MSQRQNTDLPSPPTLECKKSGTRTKEIGSQIGGQIGSKIGSANGSNLIPVLGGQRNTPASAPAGEAERDPRGVRAGHFS